MRTFEDRRGEFVVNVETCPNWECNGPRLTIATHFHKPGVAAMEKAAELQTLFAVFEAMCVERLKAGASVLVAIRDAADFAARHEPAVGMFSRYLVAKFAAKKD